MAKTKEREAAGKWGKEAPRRYLELTSYYTGSPRNASNRIDRVVVWNREKHRLDCFKQSGSRS